MIYGGQETPQHAKKQAPRLFFVSDPTFVVAVCVRWGGGFRDFDECQAPTTEGDPWLRGQPAAGRASAWCVLRPRPSGNCCRRRRRRQLLSHSAIQQLQKCRRGSVRSPRLLASLDRPVACRRLSPSLSCLRCQDTRPPVHLRFAFHLRRCLCVFAHGRCLSA